MERADIIVYSLDAGHSEEQGRVIRKKIYFVTILLSVVTTVEVLLGVFWMDFMPNAWHWVKWVFIALTMVKAAYIVMTFMHLGDERRNIRSMILLPYVLFLIYIAYILIWEATYIQNVLKIFL